MAIFSKSLKEAEYFRRRRTAKQLACRDIFLAPEYQALGVASGRADDWSAFAVLACCDMVTQWGTRQKMLLFLPLHAEALQEEQKLLQWSCDYARQNHADKLGLLCLRRKHMPEYPFRPAWEYALTVSFPIPEEALWVLPLREGELQRHGGEIDLPWGLHALWDCLE
ncbi:MAG: hypothetical protein AAF975_03110 [Spirochaetota bacterium]